MIIDTSVLVAILRGEPDGASYAEAIRSTYPRRVSAATYLELGIVIDAQGDPVASRGVDDLLSSMSITVEPVTVEQAHIAREAHRDFGRGRGHRARLNYGDCFAYALAKDLGEPLLFKGDEFVHTDIPFVGRPSERHRLSEVIASYGSSTP